MKMTARPFSFRAFTIVELLIVIAIIGILAAMLMPVLSAAQKHAKKTQAKLETSNIANAIQEYESDYSRFPVPAEIQTSGQNDFTFGGVFQSTGGTTCTVGSTIAGEIYTNGVVMAILLDYTNYLGIWNNGYGTDNTNHMKNPKRNIYLSNTRPSGWTPPCPASRRRVLGTTSSIVTPGAIPTSSPWTWMKITSTLTPFTNSRPFLPPPGLLAAQASTAWSIKPRTACPVTPFTATSWFGPPARMARSPPTRRLMSARTAITCSAGNNHDPHAPHPNEAKRPRRA